MNAAARFASIVGVAALVVACAHADVAAAAPARSVGDERRADEEAYRARYLPAQPHLVEHSRGRWLAIAEGRIVPSVGDVVSPAATMEAADAEARRVAPGAVHRFVFQVGEEGDVEGDVGGCELDHEMGVKFIALLERDDVRIRGFGPNQPIHALVGSEWRELTVKGPDDRMFLRPEVGAPLADGRATETYCVGTGSTEFVTMSGATASAAGLERWEIPGTARITDAMQRGDCRRARARFRWSGSKLDFTVPVAVWPN
jgi:hypothetical protein